jgi:hypothetical protein
MGVTVKRLRKSLFNRDGQWLPNNLMAFGFASGQVSVGMYDQLNGLPQALSSLGLRALLDIAAGQLLHVRDPPLANLLEHPGVLILHAAIVPERPADSSPQEAGRLTSAEHSRD